MLVEQVTGDDLGLGKNCRASTKWRVNGVADSTIAWGLVNAASPATLAGLVKQDVSVEELGGGLWDGTVQYGTLEAGEDGDTTWSFDIGTQNLHITQAIAHVATYGAADCDHKGAIGVRKDGNGQTVDGCDVFIPVFTWEETRYVSYALVNTKAWIRTMEGLVATINQAPFRAWAKGELLLLGISGAKRGEQAVPVTYKFASSRTRTGMTIGSGDGAITGVDKEGWAYLWIEYEQKDNTTQLTSRPKAVHVEQVYQYGDWDNLGLPDPWN